MKHISYLLFLLIAGVLFLFAPEKQQEDNSFYKVDVISPEKVTKAINYFIGSKDKERAYIHFIDNAGKQLKVLGKDYHIHQHIEHVELDAENKLMYLVMQNEKLVSLNFDDTVNWETRGNFHHDIAFDQQNIYALERELTPIKYNNKNILIFNEHIKILDKKTGEILSKTPLFEMTRQLIPEHKLKSAEAVNAMGIPKNPVHTRFDIFHTNTLEVIDCSNIYLCEEGQVYLLSFAHLNQIVILDLDKQKVLWSWGEGVLQRQHHPNYIGDGKILLLDNGNRRKYSRILEVDLKTQEYAKRYRKLNLPKFFTRQVGGVQLLNNGNTLITSGTQGRAFEITPERQVVWDFQLDREKARKTLFKKGDIYRFYRYEGQEDLF